MKTIDGVKKWLGDLCHSVSDGGRSSHQQAAGVLARFRHSEMCSFNLVKIRSSLATSIARVIAFPIVVSLASCGGGGGGGGGTQVTDAPNFTAVAMAGELLTYTLDRVKLTYSYTITDSQYGLTGNTGSGTLILNSDGTYSPSGISNARIAILPNGLLLGAIRETLNGTPTTIPIIGMSNPVTDLNAGAGTYNFVQRSCLGALCSSAYGTIQINSAGTWTSCPSENLTTGNPPCNGPRFGTVNALGGGKWQVMEGATDIGTAIMLSSGGLNMMILDLKDTRIGGFGVGLLVGSIQQPFNASQTDGTWVAATTSGLWITFDASGHLLSYLTVNGAPSNAKVQFTSNVPWSGFISADSGGGNGLLAGTGVYLYENAGGYAEIGVKIN